MIFWQQIRHPRSPFDNDNAALLEQFRKADGLEIIGAGDAIRIQMIDRQTARVVDVEQHVGRAADRTDIAAKAAKQPADELGLAGAQIAVERETFAAE